MNEEEAWFKAWVRSPLAFDWPMPHFRPFDGAQPEETTSSANVSNGVIKIDGLSDDECAASTTLPQVALPIPSRSNIKTPTESAEMVAPPERMVLRSAVNKFDQKYLSVK